MVLFPSVLRLPALGAIRPDRFDWGVRDADTAQAVLHLLAPSDAARSIKRTRPGPRTSLLVISLLTAAVMILVAFHFDRLAALGLAVMFVGAMTLTLLLRRRVPNSRSQPHLVILKGGIS